MTRLALMHTNSERRESPVDRARPSVGSALVTNERRAAQRRSRRKHAASSLRRQGVGRLTTLLTSRIESVRAVRRRSSVRKLDSHLELSSATRRRAARRPVSSRVCRQVAAADGAARPLTNCSCPGMDGRFPLRRTNSRARKCRACRAGGLPRAARRPWDRRSRYRAFRSDQYGAGCITSDLHGHPAGMQRD